MSSSPKRQGFADHRRPPVSGSQGARLPKEAAKEKKELPPNRGDRGRKGERGAVMGRILTRGKLTEDMQEAATVVRAALREAEPPKGSGLRPDPKWLAEYIVLRLADEGLIPDA